MPCIKQFTVHACKCFLALLISMFCWYSWQYSCCALCRYPRHKKYLSKIVNEIADLRFAHNKQWAVHFLMPLFVNYCWSWLPSSDWFPCLASLRVYGHTEFCSSLGAPGYPRFTQKMVGWLVGWSLTMLSTQFRSYHAFKVKIYYKYLNNLMIINFWGKIIEKEKYNNNSRFGLNKWIKIR